MITIVGFLSRLHGFNVLSSLILSPNYKIIKVYTHSLNPKSQDPNIGERSDFKSYLELCETNNISLISVDNKNEEISNFPKCDFIIEVSWRYLIPQSITKKANIAAFGIHRGKLPEYAGAEPIKQALMSNEKEIIISAHKLDPKIDAGKTITTISHPVNYQNNQSLEDNIQRLRDEITPLFSKIVLKTLDLFRKNS